MQLGLQIPSFSWPGGPTGLAGTLTGIATAADAAGYHSVWVMDHFFQIRNVGAAEEPMLEAYTTLGYLAARTSRVRLGTLVTGATYRQPGLLAKIVTTLDVLSGGRAWLGVGAAWNEEEHLGLGVPFPPIRERFEILEDTLRICLQMFQGNDAPFEGRRFHLGRTLNSPPPLTTPHPPILVGGGGERRTLALVARYADACNLFAGPAELPHKLAVLREHCDKAGRDYDAILKTVYYRMDLGDNGSRVPQVIDELGALAEAGAQKAIGLLKDAHRLDPVHRVGRDVIPAIAGL